MKDEFNDQVRRKLRQFVERRGWSVSRFAARYVDAYADMYSKMEAPSVSTARKLIEDKAHKLNEKEAIVLDTFTELNLQAQLLEEQKRVLISKTDSYLKEDSKPKVMDSETMLINKIRILEKVPKSLTPDDVAAIARRYVDLDTRKPLVIFSGHITLLESVIETLGPGAISIMQDDIGHLVRKLAKVYYTVIDAETPDEIIKYISDGTDWAAFPYSPKRYIMLVLTDNWKLIEEVRTCADDIISFTANGGGNLISALHDLPIKPSLHPINANRLRKCLKYRDDFPELFKAQIHKCIDSPWVHFPNFESGRECMTFLVSQLHNQREIYYESYDSPEGISIDGNPPEVNLADRLRELIEYGFPANWFLPECDQLSLLRAMQAMHQLRGLKKDHPEISAKAVESLLDGDYEWLLTFGRVPHRSIGEWGDWIAEHYWLCMMEPDYEKMIDTSIAKERRLRFMKKKSK